MSWFSFKKSVSASAVGVAGRKRVRICSVVLPMGFTSATGFMHAWHRSVVLRPNPSSDGAQAALDAQMEVRGDRPFPLSASSGHRDGWSIYIDDVLDISILQRHELVGSLGAVSGSQSVVRDVYVERSIPRNVPKSTVSSLTDEHVGYLFDGDHGDIGVRPARLLEIASIGLLMLLRQANPLLIYQVFTGKLAHSPQVRRPLWSNIY